ncbi:MAG: TolC family protein [Gammaproteobacteria bacterium]
MSRGLCISGTRLCCAVLLGSVCACAPQRYVPAPLAQDELPLAIANADLAQAEHVALMRELGGHEPLPPPAWSCTELGPIGVYRSRAVGAVRADVVAARAARVVAGQRPNPTVGLTLQYDDEKDPGDDTHYTIGPSFRFLWSPVDRGRIRAALADAEFIASRARVLAAAWSVRDTVCRAALDLRSAQVGQDHLDRREDLLEDAIELARTAAEIGLGDAFAWQSLKLEANTAKLARLDHLRAITTAGSTLASALALPLEAVRGIKLATPNARTEPLPLATVQRHALGHHPEVLEALAVYDKAEHDLELAMAAQYPDLDLSPSYLFDQGDNVWSLVGGIVVPLFASHDAPIAAAAARRDAARARFETVQAAVIGQVQSAHSQWLALLDLRAAVEHTAAQLADDVARLQSALAAGVGDGLLVARARVQQALLDARLAELDLDLARTILGLQHSAALPLDDALFARQLERLYAEPTAVEE